MIDKRFPHAYASVRAALLAHLGEPPPRKVQLLSGPRQVGKTHLLLEVAQASGQAAIYAAADAPAAALPGWWEAQWAEAERVAAAEGRAVLLLDEIHALSDWGRRLKAEHDRIVRRKLPIHVVATGSSSLRIGRGARETMAGRFEHLRLLHWAPGDLARLLGLEPNAAVGWAMACGTYPGALAFRGDEARLRAYVRDAIVEPALGRDLLALETIRRPALVRQLFAVAAAHPAEIVTLQKLRGELADPGALETIAHYLELLESSYLVAGVRKYSAQALRRRASPPKLVVLNQALLAEVHDPRAELDSGGRPPSRQVENACAALAWNAGQEVFYWREEPYELDLVTRGSWGEWAIEVKTGRVTRRDLAGLLRFVGRYRRFRPLLVHAPTHSPAHVLDGTSIAARDWRQFLLEGPPA
jgi:hypothetical protein